LLQLLDEFAAPLGELGREIVGRGALAIGYWTEQ
jgi:hypothetical protein